MAFNFPSLPSIGQQHQEGGLTWEWDGASWISIPSISSVVKPVVQDPTTGQNQVIESAANADTPLSLKGTAGQTAAYFKILSSTSTVLAQILSDGRYRLPGDPLNSLDAATKQYVDDAIAALPSDYVSLNGQSIITNQNTTDIGLRIDGVVGQSGDLQHRRDNTDAVLASVESDGAFYTAEQLDVDDYTTGGARIEKTGTTHLTDENRASSNLPATGLMRLAPDASVQAIRVRLDTGQTADAIYVEDEGGTGNFSVSATGEVGIGDLGYSSGYIQLTETGRGVFDDSANGVITRINYPTSSDSIRVDLTDTEWRGVYVKSNFTSGSPSTAKQTLAQLETSGGFSAYPALDFNTDRPVGSNIIGSVNFLKSGATIAAILGQQIDSLSDRSRIRIQVKDGGSLENQISIEASTQGGVELEGNRWLAPSSLPGSPASNTIYVTDDGVYKGSSYVAGFEPAAEVTWTAWVAGNAYNANHNIGRKPHFAVGVFRCKSADNGYSVGDEVYFSDDAWTENSNQGCSFHTTATQCGIHVQNNVELPTRTGVSQFTPTNGNWNIVVKVW